MPALVWAGVEIDQRPLTVGKPVEPNIWFILDDSGSMGWDWMPDTADSTGINGSTFTRNTLSYNPYVTYQPWRNSDGTMMPPADRRAVSTSDNQVTGSTIDLTSAARCFHVPRDAVTGDPSPLSNANLYRWRLNTNNTASRCSANSTCTNNTGCVSIAEFSWTDAEGNTITRSIEEEWQNYANWRHYYRTRMKMAKAAVTRAFSGLGDRYRVGYTSIWDRNRYEIPVSNNNGLFTGANRETWFANLLAANASGNTPLRAALDRAGQYFSTAAPYRNSDGTELSCRQNFAILTTDGYWNDAAAATAGARQNNDGSDGDKDGRKITGPRGVEYEYKAVRPYTDDRSNTLADVAMYYWKNDLRPTENNVPTTPENPAFWQHMRTFGISIGERGVLNPSTDLGALTAGTLQWPEPAANRQANIDDLWHATVNSRGEFIVASDPEEFARALQNTLGKIGAQAGRSASGAASSTNISAGGMTYFSEYVSGSWHGDVHGYELDPDTGLRKSGATRDWSASAMLPAWRDRNVVFNQDGALAPLRWTALSTAQRAALASEAVVNYVRGERSNEATDTNPSGTLRAREGLFGSFVNSQPVYVGAPPFTKYYSAAATPGANTYTAHAVAQKNRIPMLYVGGNDGMLHGFVAETVREGETVLYAGGTELIAFMPSAVITERLRAYATEQEYEHRYFVDGELTVAEAYIGGNWKTILVGSLGRGGRSIFALDVTDPTAITLLWEKTAEDIPALGNVLGKPIIAEVGPDLGGTFSQSDWRVLIGNGPNGAGDRAQLISISLVDGSVKTYDTGAGGNNGLSAVLVWDSNKDGYFETVYAGDLRGNVWRFSGLDQSSAPEPFRLFTTAGNRSITAAPWAGINQRDGRTWVFIGTGQYLNESDRADVNTQSWYGLIDDSTPLSAGTSIGARSESLVQRRILETGTLSGRGARTLEPGNEAEITGAGKRGWYIDFTQTGERMITPNSFFGNALIGNTFIPDGTDLCKPGGRSALWGINPFTGGRLSGALFDFNRNGDFKDDKLGALFPSVMDDLKPILVGVPPITVKEDKDRKVVVMHTDPDDSEQFQPPAGTAEAQSWREVIGE